MAKDEIKTEEVKTATKGNWVTYGSIGKLEVTQVKVIDGIKMYLVK